MSTTRNILVADDNPVIFEIVRFSLERAGYRVACRVNGLAALEAARREQFDLVITDLQMPRMDGITLLRTLREDERYAHTPAILCTAKGFELDKQAIIDELRLLDVVSKPFSPLAIVNLVQKQFASVATRTDPVLV